MNRFDFKIVCGHYGCGKTNFSINLAIDKVKKGEKVTLVDLDLVNPYFRSSDYRKLLDTYGINLIASNFAHTNLDIPSLPAEMYSILFEQNRSIIIDAGGDDVGATALGRFSNEIKKYRDDYEFYYIVNRYRISTASVENTVKILKEIERASRLKATGVVNNSHMQNETEADTIMKSLGYASEVAKELGLPLLKTTSPRFLFSELRGKIENLYPLDIYVKPPW